MEVYPIKEKIKEVLEEKNKKLGWLLGQIDKSSSWFFKIQAIEDLQFKTILDISDKLEFDFVLDYYKWKGQSVAGFVDEINEPTLKYNLSDTGMELTVTLKGTGKQIDNRFLEIFKTVKGK
jgi:hypothetical protein